MDFKKAGYLLALTLLLFGAISFYSHDITATKDQKLTIGSAENFSKKTLKNHVIHQEYMDRAAKAMIINKAHGESSQKELLEFVKWQHQHGYPLLDQHGEVIPTGYENYPTETLNTLANQGDARAMLMLGTQNMLNANFYVAEKYFLDASIRGYTISLGELANVKFMQAKKSIQTNNIEESNKIAEDAFAWLEAGLKRGDKALLFNKSTYELTYPQDETTRQKIIVKAEVYYEQLNQKRIQLGLGEFDNTYPKAMDFIFSPSPQP